MKSDHRSGYFLVNTLLQNPHLAVQNCGFTTRLDTKTILLPSKINLNSLLQKDGFNQSEAVLKVLNIYKLRHSSNRLHLSHRRP